MTLPPQVQTAVDVLAQHDISAKEVAPFWYRQYLRFRPETPPPLWGGSQGYWRFVALKTALGAGIALTLIASLIATHSGHRGPQENLVPLTPAAYLAIWALSVMAAWLFTKEIADRSRQEGERIGLQAWKDFSPKWRPSLTDLHSRNKLEHYWLRSLFKQPIVNFWGWIGFVAFWVIGFLLPTQAGTFGEGVAGVYVALSLLGGALTARRVPMRYGAKVWYAIHGVFIGAIASAMLWETLPASVMGVSVGHSTLAFFAFAFLIHALEAIHYEEQKNVALRVERAEQQQQLAETRLQALKAQIEPHFIFNNIAHLKSLIATDPTLAQQMADELSDFLRGSLKALRAGHTTVREEFELARTYLALAKLRMGDRLSTHLQLSARAADLKIPPLMVQTLLENAIYHGVERKAGNVSIKLSAELIEHKGGERLQIRVVDDGMGFGSGQSGGSGVGLANIRERLASTYGGAGELVLTANTPSGVIAELNLPGVQ